jgi:hypothetical protein
MSAEGSTDAHAIRTAHARRVAGVILLAAAAGAAFLFSYDSSFYTCEHTTGAEAADTCKPPGVELLALLFLPGVLLFVPDIQELNIFGIGVTKADVDAAKQQAADATRIAGLAVSVSVNAGLDSDETLRESAPAEGLAAAQRSKAVAQPVDRAEFTRRWRRLEPRIQLAKALADANGSAVRAAMKDPSAQLPPEHQPALAALARPLDDQTLTDLLRWRVGHLSALAALEAAALSAVELPDDDLRRLIDAARRLEELLPEALVPQAA